MSPTAEETVALLDGINPPDTETARYKLRDAARRLLARLDSPYERATFMCFEQPVLHAVVHTCCNLGLWEAWYNVGGGEKNLEELVGLAPVKCDPNLLRTEPPFDILVWIRVR